MGQYNAFRRFHKQMFGIGMPCYDQITKARSSAVPKGSVSECKAAISLQSALNFQAESLAKAININCNERQQLVLYALIGEDAFRNVDQYKPEVSARFLCILGTLEIG